MRKAISIFLSVVLLAVLAMTASAETTTSLHLSMVDENVPVAGVIFEIYRVGQADGTGAWKLTGKFADDPVKVDDLGEDTGAAASALYAFAKKNSRNPDAIAVTGSNGVGVVEGLESGIYLVAGLPHEADGVSYHTEPQLLALPWVDAVTGEIDYEPIVAAKFDKETGEKVSLKVLKIWEDHSGNVRPVSLKVHLLKDGEVHDTVTLTAENSWRHVWEDLDSAALWQIVEEVPEHYTVQVERDGNTFLLKNTAPEMPPPEEPSDPSIPTVPGEDIPQTGMVWWPALVLGGLGIALVVGGLALAEGRKE